MFTDTGKEPLVSVVVITYNSSKYVLETLDSIKLQSYGNIELIVTDDCSPDDTVDICRKWIDENSGRFAGAELITVEKNTGISGNCNRGLYAARGEWIKIIAGDDLLENDCISEYMSFTRTDPSIRYVSCKITMFSDQERKYEPVSAPDSFFQVSAERQLRYLLAKGNFIVGASVFLNVGLTRELGGFDERFPMIDDYPLFIKICDAGYKFHLLVKPLVRYRIHEGNISLSGNSLFTESSGKYYDERIPRLLLKNRMFLQYWHAKIVILKKRFPKDRGAMYRMIRLGLSMLSPVYYYTNLLKLFNIDYSQRI